MKNASRITLGLAVLAVLAAAWQPVGSWWQWGITAVVLVFVGAACGAAADRGKVRPHPADGSIGRSTGPHLHFSEKSTEEDAVGDDTITIREVGGMTADEVVEQFERERERKAALRSSRPEYGKRSM